MDILAFLKNGHWTPPLPGPYCYTFGCVLNIYAVYAIYAVCCVYIMSIPCIVLCFLLCT